MFCEHQEPIVVSNDYDNNSEIVLICNLIGKKCPFSKLKKAQKRCADLEPIKEAEDD